MKTIDVRSPEGNVFCILGFVKSYQKQLKKKGLNDKDLDFIFSNYFDMEYDEILDRLEKTKLFKFVNRDNRNKKN